MNIKASGRSALILATGIWLGFAGPSYAAAPVSDGDAGSALAGTGSAFSSAVPSASASPGSDEAAQAPLALVKTTHHASHHLKKVAAHRKSAKVADKAAADKKAPVADDADNATSAPAAGIPSAVANANAQLPAADASADSAKAMSERASNILQAAPATSADAPAGTPPVVASDQLNDVDRALRDNPAPAAAPSAPPVTVASADGTFAAASPLVAVAGNDNSTWDQTSLIGKLFIGFGALLTMASAARMFMA